LDAPVVIKAKQAKYRPRLASSP